MIYQSAEKLEEKVGNKYALVIVAAKRARQLKEGAMPLCEVASPSPLSIALGELGEDQIVALAPPEPEELDRDLARTDASQAVALLASIGGADLDLGEEYEEEEEEEEESEEPEAEAAAAEEEEEEEGEAEAAGEEGEGSSGLTLAEESEDEPDEEEEAVEEE